MENSKAGFSRVPGHDNDFGRTLISCFIQAQDRLGQTEARARIQHIVLVLQLKSPIGFQALAFEDLVFFSQVEKRP